MLLGYKMHWDLFMLLSVEICGIVSFLRSYRNLIYLYYRCVHIYCFCYVYDLTLYVNVAQKNSR